MALFYSVSTQPVSLVHSRKSSFTESQLLRVDQLFVHHFRTCLKNGNIIAFDLFHFSGTFLSLVFSNIFSSHDETLILVNFHNQNQRQIDCFQMENIFQTKYKGKMWFSWLSLNMSANLNDHPGGDLMKLARWKQFILVEIRATSCVVWISSDIGVGLLAHPVDIDFTIILQKQCILVSLSPKYLKIKVKL